MTTASLLPAVMAGLSAATTLGYDSSSAAHDVYEGYMLTLLLRAAANEHWRWDLRDRSGTVKTHAVFRRGPGRLPLGGFTHAHLTKTGKADLEAHIGVKVRGSSGVLHEFDLLVLPSSKAASCRLHQHDPTRGDVVLHAEAKYYGGDLPLPLGRAVVGLTVDCDLFGKSVLVTNQNGPMVEKLINNFQTAFRFLIKPSNAIGEYHLIRLFETFLRAAP